MHFTRGSVIGLSMFLVLLTFAVLDAGTLAWSASVISGRQFAAELFTFFAIMVGAVVTVWRMVL